MPLVIKASHILSGYLKKHMVSRQENTGNISPKNLNLKYHSSYPSSLPLSYIPSLINKCMIKSKKCVACIYFYLYHSPTVAILTYHEDKKGGNKFSIANLKSIYKGGDHTM